MSLSPCQIFWLKFSYARTRQVLAFESLILRDIFPQSPFTKNWIHMKKSSLLVPRFGWDLPHPKWGHSVGWQDLDDRYAKKEGDYDEKMS